LQEKGDFVGGESKVDLYGEADAWIAVYLSVESLLVGLQAYFVEFFGLGDYV
jgi:hypothetical protein